MDVLEMCAHRGCRCDAREDGFCSDHCAGHSAEPTTTAHPCECGHDDCATGPAAECVWG
jgi:hypothetical protein